uniref:UPF0020 domain-containing protein n=1 Tax=Angiostrongylus cantonensis TaxID=6313 RepID=A0A0K0DI18_ANGCA
LLFVCHLGVLLCRYIKVCPFRQYIRLRKYHKRLETLQLIRQRGIARAAGNRELTSELAKQCRQAIKEDLEERAAAVMVDAAEAGKSIRKARRRDKHPITVVIKGLENVVHGQTRVDENADVADFSTVACFDSRNSCDIILDPMCGGGSIPLEGALAYDGCLFIGADTHPKAMQRCSENMKYCDQQLLNNGSEVAFLCCDALLLPFPTSSINAIVTDLPFGKKIGSVGDNRVIYPRLLVEWERVVKGGGRLVVMTHDKRSWGKSRFFAIRKSTGFEWRKVAYDKASYGQRRWSANPMQSSY